MKGFEIYKDGELVTEATHKDCLLVRQEGNRQVQRNIAHYNLLIHNHTRIVPYFTVRMAASTRRRRSRFSVEGE